MFYVSVNTQNFYKMFFDLVGFTPINQIGLYLILIIKNNK